MHLNKSGLLTASLLLASPLLLTAQPGLERFSVHTGKNLPYRYLQYNPPDYDKDPAQKWPLVFFLHGSGERGTDLTRLPHQAIPKLIANGQNFPFILIAPQCPENAPWNINTLDQLLTKIIADNPRIDRDRIYLTGLSSGGFATWDLGMSDPGKFAALVPICGGSRTKNINAVKKIPIWAFHGQKDEYVPVQNSIDLANALKKIHGNIQLTIYPEATHDSWTETYNNPKLYEWLLKQNRQNQ
jgi:predicted peptidase